MSAKSSDSESSSWIVLSNEDTESSDDGSTGSSDFVKVENQQSVRYHHSQPSGSQGHSEDDTPTAEQPPISLDLRLDTENSARRTSEDEDAEQTAVEPEDLSPADGSAGSSHSSIEHLTAAETQEPEADVMQRSTASSIEIVDAAEAQAEQVVDYVTKPDVERAASDDIRRLRSDSDSDHSDFVRLDPTAAEEHNSGDVMRLSDISAASSSLSCGFRFIHRSNMVLGAEEYVRRRMYRDNDDESVQSDVDDRCESDISGVADDDLSSYSLGEVPISAENVRRSYTHRPNNNLNRILTTLALVVLFGAVGIGVGHFLGTRSGARLRTQQVERLQTLSDEYLGCLQYQDDLEKKVETSKDQGQELVARMWRARHAHLQQQQPGTPLPAFEDWIVWTFTDYDLDLLPLTVEQVLEMAVSVPSNAEEKYLRELEHTKRVADDEFFQQSYTRIFQQQQRQEGISRKQFLEWAYSLPEDDQQHVFTPNAEQLAHDLKSQGTELSELAEELETTHEAERVQERTKSTGEVAVLKNEVNTLRIENEELKSSVAKMRYQTLAIADRAATQPISTELVEQLNELANENSDLKEEVGKLRYSSHPGNDETAKPALTEYATVDVTETVNQNEVDKPEIESEEQEPVESVAELKQKLVDTTEQLESATGRADMWQSLFHVEREKAAQAEGKAPDIVSCLRIMFPDVTLHDLAQFSHNTVDNLTQFLTNQVHFIQNMTEDDNFSRLMKEKWSDLKTILDTPTVKGAKETARNLYSDIYDGIADKFRKFKTTSSSPSSEEESPSAKEQTDETDKTENAENAKLPKEESLLNKGINKTKETVHKLTQKINETWNQVKYIPGKITETVMPKVSEKVEKLAQKVDQGWQHVKRKVNEGWFERENQKKRDNSKKHDERTNRGRHDIPVEARKQYHGDPYKNFHDNDDPDDSVYPKPNLKEEKFENKPDHKQRQSTTHPDKKYEEFWSSVGFDPDDFFHDGFFEGNDRKWRKHQKKLKKLHGKIQKLNEDILHDMEDDDIEDLYDDLEDLEDDLDENPQPATLKTWLSCQVRWWKGRFQRKHRNEDLLQGCGRQLMHWQMKSSCCAKCKKMSSVVKKVHRSPTCQHFMSATVIQTVSNSKHNKHQNKAPHNHADRMPHDYPDMPYPVDDVMNLTLVLDDLDKSDKPVSNNPGDHSEKTLVDSNVPDEDETPDWLFERARDLEYRMHKTDWVYERARERDYHHKKPDDWYHARAQAREDKHNAFTGRR